MICPRCQTINGDAARFCSNCGQGLEAAPRPPDGERKLVTVLFADVAGSTAMAERLDPELVTDVMNGAFAFMNRAVDRYGGTVARLMGDAVLAIFGAPLAHEDDAERAVRAALEMQAAAGDYAAGIRQQYGVEFHVRVGIHTGLAVLDQVGDRVRAEYTAMGDTPNVAARLQSAAAPGSVLVSADTHRLVQHAFDFEPRGLVEVKGKAAPVDVWQATGIKAGWTSARGLAGLRAPMVGRTAEIERLRARLRALAAGGTGGWVTIVGEAGLGKSRLLAELRQSLPQPEAITWLEGRCISYGQSISYLPWRQIVRQSIGAQEGEAEAGIRARLQAAARQLDGLPSDDLPFLETVLAVASEASLAVVRGYAGDDLVRRMTAAARGYLRAQARVRPLVVVFEDLHWADEASLALLESVADLVAHEAVLIIGLMRPDREVPAWALAGRVRQRLGPGADEIALEPLSEPEARQLLGLLLHIEDLPASVRGLILAKAEGNPFFVEEVIRSLLDSGRIVQVDGHWRATHAIERVSIPTTLAGLLGARIDALPEDAKRVAQMAAVLGRSFALPVLKAVCAAAPPTERLPDIMPLLDLLAQHEILRVRAEAPEVEYAFKHALTQEAAYNSLLLRRRREFHGRAGQALERLYAERLEEFAPVLAHHFWQAEEWEPAGVYARRAGDAALRVYALREAMRQFDRAIEAFNRTGGHDIQVYEAILGWAKAALKFRPYPEQIERLQRAEQIARALNDKRRLAAALHGLGAAHVNAGHNLWAAPAYTEAFELAEELGDESLAVIPSFHAALSKLDTDLQGALALFDRAIELARKHGHAEQEAYALSAKAMALGRLGRAAESQAAVQHAIDLVRSTGSPIAESDVELFAGWAYLDLGNVQAALEHGQRGVDLAVATDNFDCICGGLVCVGLGHMQVQQMPQATSAFKEAIEQTKVSGVVRFEIMAQGGLALIKLAMGQPGALAELEQAAARANETHDPFTAARLEHALAQARLGHGDLAGAQADLDRAREYFEGNDMRPFLDQVQATQAALDGQRAAQAERTDVAA